MTVSSAFIKFTIISAILCFVAAGVIVFIVIAPVYIFMIAYLISFVFTATNFFVMNKIYTKGNRTFFAWFVGSFAVRFVGAILAVIIAVKMLNSFEIYFTVSFLFSYLCHSTIEIIYLNKILKTDT